MKNLLIKLLILFFLSITSISFSNDKNVYIDSKGILRWKLNDKEVRLFGVNYTTPFAYSYRAHKRLGLSLKKSIDIDVNHFARLGLDAFRIHIWDREISDKGGNLINNEHLHLFDYLLYKLSQKGIKVILTPIAWWGTAWPEPEFETPGFSNFYSKVEMITNPKAREAQKNYLKQIINHINPYTKLAYKDDPSIIALEIINEPHHPDDTSMVKQYINEMYDVLREAGFSKPIFYNISENWNDAQAQAVCNSKVEGISFQWYPTGLVHNKMLNGNYLINVNKYKIPSENIKGFEKKAKMVYEFDAADIGASIMYPAMARSFVEAGMQFAAMFAYDPVQIAWSNTEYQTHFMNLLYTPSKAISLMIASKVFHNFPRMKSYGDYPNNNIFENFRVSYEENLSEFNSLTEFIYSNSTNTKPILADSLKLIAGVGNSAIVEYDGTGAYFLDKLRNGIWRLEVYPDLLWIRDPFEQTSLSRQVARLYWNKRKMRINLSDLSNKFSVIDLVYPNKNSFNVTDAEFFIEPGIYLLTAENVDKNKIKKYTLRKEKFLDGIYLPHKKSNPIEVVNNTPSYLFINDFRKFEFQIAVEKEIAEASIYIKRLGWRRFEKHPLIKIGSFNYIIKDSIKILTPGELEYCVSVKIDDKIFTFPNDIQSSPEVWDFYSDKLWKVKILDFKDPIVLFDASRDRKNIVFPQFSRTMRFLVDYKNGSDGENNSLFIKVNASKENEIPFGFQINVSNIIKPLKGRINNYNRILIKVRTDSDSLTTAKINFITTQGQCYQTKIEINKDWQDYEIPLSNFKEGSCLILPFSYPQFLPKIWEPVQISNDNKFKIDDIEFLQILLENYKSIDTSFEIESLIIK